jgi:acetyltransferase-like isoleucine patch superfamily enzyme
VLPSLVRRLLLRALNLGDRLRLRARVWLEPGLEIEPGASPNLAVARFRLAPGARLRIAAGVAADRRPGAITFLIEPGAEVVIRRGAWLRTEVAPVLVAAFAGARIEIGPDCLLNGCHLSAKRSVTLERRAWVGPGSRIFDSDQHDFDADRPERSAPVRVGECAWIASDVTVLRGVTIGAHSVVGARSLVTSDVPPHTLAYGVPARPRGPVGDRSAVR